MLARSRSGDTDRFEIRVTEPALPSDESRLLLEPNQYEYIFSFVCFFLIYKQMADIVLCTEVKSNRRVRPEWWWWKPWPSSTEATADSRATSLTSWSHRMMIWPTHWRPSKIGFGWTTGRAWSASSNRRHRTPKHATWLSQLWPGSVTNRWKLARPPPSSSTACPVQQLTIASKLAVNSFISDENKSFRAAECDGD